MKKHVIFGKRPGYKGVSCFVPNLTYKIAKRIELGLTEEDYYNRIGVDMPKKVKSKEEIKEEKKEEKRLAKLEEKRLRDIENQYKED